MFPLDTAAAERSCSNQKHKINIIKPVDRTLNLAWQVRIAIGTKRNIFY